MSNFILVEKTHVYVFRGAQELPYEVKARAGEPTIFNKKDGLGKETKDLGRAAKMVRVKGKVSRANVGTVASPATDLANAGTSGKCPQKP